MNDIDRDGLRRLTLGEINLARTLYSFSIRYNEVWIHRASYLPFNMQASNYAMTSNGEMYFQEGVYESDFYRPFLKRDRVGGQHIFLHEMMHVWQHQRGMMVRTREHSHGQLIITTSSINQTSWITALKPRLALLVITGC
ncbi:hypothetical protein [Lelliottia sp.]|uniref:hypothetical protein n=1 Tax=Lelliottia sp. TaxID=1898429 RepID=UPI00388E65FD